MKTGRIGKPQPRQGAVRFRQIPLKDWQWIRNNKGLGLNRLRNQLGRPFQKTQALFSDSQKSNTGNGCPKRAGRRHRRTRRQGMLEKTRRRVPQLAAIQQQQQQQQQRETRRKRPSSSFSQSSLKHYQDPQKKKTSLSLAFG